MHSSFLFRIERLGHHGCALRSTVLVVVLKMGRKCRRIENDFACQETTQVLIGQQLDDKIRLHVLQPVLGGALPPDQLELLGLPCYFRPAV